MCRYAEGISDPVEECEHRGDVNSLGDLWLGPPVVAQSLYVLRCRLVRSFGNLLYILEQFALCRGEVRPVQVTARNGLYSFFFGSLDTQEVGMRIQSIRTSVEVRHPAGYRFLGLAVKMSL